MTTLIILVASVVLGTGVVLYGTSLFQTGGQTQAIATQGVKMWVNATCTGAAANGCPANTVAWGAAAIRNSGDVLVSVNTIQVRGVIIPFSSWYVDTNSSHTSANFQAQFISTGTSVSGMMRQNAFAFGQTATCPTQVLTAGIPNEITINEQGTPDATGQPYSTTMLCLKQASGPIALTPGAQMIVYFNVPGSVIGPVDSGSQVTASILAGNVGGPASITVANS
ncbi:MAG TPA: hypothetical protein VEU72_05325 [Nitrosopumilaceae archaeon]|nr:hypothetical protein [Nitrosopumilaceae archaeon]